MPPRPVREKMTLGHLSVILGQTAFAGFLVKAGQIMTRLPHHVHYLVERHTVYTIGETAVYVCIQCTCGGIGITLDTGYLHKTADWIAGHAKMVLQAHFRSILDLCGRTAKELVGSSRSHGTCHTYLALASHLGTGNGGIGLYHIAKQGSCGQSLEDALLGEVAALPQVIQHTGNNTT